jgi:hypothetical protein
LEFGIKPRRHPGRSEAETRDPGPRRQPVFLDPGSARLKPLVRDDGGLFFAEVQALENRTIIIG